MPWRPVRSFLDAIESVQTYLQLASQLKSVTRSFVEKETPRGQDSTVPRFHPRGTLISLLAGSVSSKVPSHGHALFSE